MADTIDPKTKQPKKTGTGFTNIQQVGQANVQNQLGKTIGSGVSKVGQQAKQQLGQATGQFKSQMGQTQSEIGQAQELKQGLAGTQFKAGDVSGQQKLEELGQKYGDTSAGLRAGYKGPTGLQDSEQIKRQAIQAAGYGRQVGSDVGRQSLLRRFATSGAGPYSQGQQRLDAMLLGKQLDPLRQAKQSVRGLDVAAETESQAAELQGQAAKSQFGATARDVENLISEKSTGLAKNLDEVAKSRSDMAQREADNIQKSLQAGSLSQDQVDRLSQLGIDPNQALYMKPADLATFISAKTDFTKQDVYRTQDEAARQALAKLSGKSAQDILNIDPTKIDQAFPDLKVDKNRLAESNKAAQEAFERDPELNEWKDINTRTAVGTQILANRISLSPGVGPQHFADFKKFAEGLNLLGNDEENLRLLTETAEAYARENIGGRFAATGGRAERKNLVEYMTNLYWKMKTDKLIGDKRAGAFTNLRRLMQQGPAAGITGG